MLLSPGRSLWECPILPSEVLFIMLIFSLTGVLFIRFILIGGEGCWSVDYHVLPLRYYAVSHFLSRGSSTCDLWSAIMNVPHGYCSCSIPQECCLRTLSFRRRPARSVLTARRRPMSSGSDLRWVAAAAALWSQQNHISHVGIRPPVRLDGGCADHIIRPHIPDAHGWLSRPRSVCLSASVCDSDSPCVTVATRVRLSCRYKQPAECPLNIRTYTGA